MLSLLYSVEETTSTHAAPGATPGSFAPGASSTNEEYFPHDLKKEVSAIPGANDELSSSSVSDDEILRPIEEIPYVNFSFFFFFKGKQILFVFIIN